MTLDFWAKTSGTGINIFTVLIGTSFGLVFAALEMINEDSKMIS